MANRGGLAGAPSLDGASLSERQLHHRISGSTTVWNRLWAIQSKPRSGALARSRTIRQQTGKTSSRIGRSGAARSVLPGTMIDVSQLDPANRPRPVEDEERAWLEDRLPGVPRATLLPARPLRRPHAWSCVLLPPIDWTLADLLVKAASGLDVEADVVDLLIARR